MEIINLFEAIMALLAARYINRYKKGKLRLSPEREEIRQRRLRSKNWNLLSIISLILLYSSGILLLLFVFL
jgi:hypothetical protein